MNNHQHTHKDNSNMEQLIVSNGQRQGFWQPLPAMLVVVMTVFIVIAARQSSNHIEGATGINNSDPARMGASLPPATQSQDEPMWVKVTIEKGGKATLFNDNLRIYLDKTTLNKDTNRYLASFRVTSANFLEFGVDDADAAEEAIYFYPQPPKYNIRLVKVIENYADFYIVERKKENSH